MEAENKAILFRLPEDLDQALRDLADRKERSIAAQLRFLVKEAVEREGISPPENGGSHRSTAVLNGAA